MHSDVLAFSRNGLRLDHRRSGRQYPCSADAHRELAGNPRLFCGPTAPVVDLTVTGEGTVALETAEVPYCRIHELELAPPGDTPARGRPWPIGLNITVSVEEDDQTLVVARRSSALAGGGAWHVTACESSEPSDFQNGGDNQIAAAHRALREELGIDLPVGELRRVTLMHSLIRVRGAASLALAAHVSLGRLGVTFGEVVAGHARAEDGWESEQLTAVNARDFTAWAARQAWTPWGRTCWATTMTACYPELVA